MMRGRNVLVLSFLLFHPAAQALISPEFWDGTMPCLSVDGRQVELQPDFTRQQRKQSSYIMRSATKLLRDMQHSTCFRGCSHVDQAESKKEAAAALKDSSLIDVNAWRVSWSSLTEEEKKFIEEGRKLSESIKHVRVRLANDPSLMASDEGAVLMEEFQKGVAVLEQLRLQVANATAPFLSGIAGDLSKSLAPLQGFLMTCQDKLSHQFTRFMLGPAVSSALGNAQALCGLAALVDLIEITKKIRATCEEEREGRGSLRKALLHLHRAESDVLSAGSALDRIISDSLAERQVDRKDMKLFALEQHDLAVQLANVRSHLLVARSHAQREITSYDRKAKQWGLMSILLAVSSKLGVTAAGALAPLSELSVGAAMSVAALQLVMRLVRGRVKDQLDDLQQRHDEALSEHAGLHAQFSEVRIPPPPQEAQEKVKDEPIFLHAGNIRERIKLGDLDHVDDEHVLSQLRSLVNEPNSGGEGADIEADELRQLKPLIEKLLKRREEAANQQARATSLPLAAAEDKPQDSAASVASTERTSHPAEVLETRKQSGIRPPSVRLSTPPHPPDPRCPSPRAEIPIPRSQLRPPSLGLTREAREVSAGPWRKEGAVRVKLEERASVEPPHPLRATKKVAMTPDPQSVARRDSLSVGASEDDAGRGERRLEDQLLQLLLMRMEITSDPHKKQTLKTLADQLREATRAARQQMKASMRTEMVLKDCVDPTLAQKILEAQEAAAQQTQATMRECLQATMLALEDECNARTAMEVAAGMRDARDVEASSAGGREEEVKVAAWKEFLARQSKAAMRRTQSADKR
ncbi:hypothetical protein GUITHDRAFT_114600 [Guillardia theta CCMP2712]|uniref:Uncharacterized protein n=1 Tax=Guillardia theta (strain CCMP2712) TaxID=905079 RepID=L1IU83_GUITC|nr:hypothetical protein GUITHDRAFT_114600 [Guillardia theta CCMP2712]EKX39400.1 hypothetical protein GUITHDRAFT_114600 [Guillardia theta CCMP2712]|eukprot:XP_005826380.1 hypothetical protein GUITHDRAFT_114600 [Guillardia theta CCMP2712]